MVHLVYGLLLIIVFINFQYFTASSKALTNKRIVYFIARHWNQEIFTKKEIPKIGIILTIYRITTCCYDFDSATAYMHK